MKLYFVRHGESEANIQHVISNRESPFGLTERGREQARALAEKLKDIPFTAVYSSPVRRARETAEIVSRSFHLPYRATEALREYDCGSLEERSDDEAWRLHREIAEDWTLHQNHGRKPEGGENFLEIQERFIPFIENIAQDGRQSQDHILFVSHGGLLQLMLPEMLTNVDHAFVQSHGIGHTQCIVVEPRAGDLRCLQWGNIHFGNHGDKGGH